MLDEGAEQAGIGLADGEVAIHQNFCFSHFFLRCGGLVSG
jgi:hypothetical protein